MKSGIRGEKPARISSAMEPSGALIEINHAKIGIYQ
jgi:hypothetical protein